MSLAPKKLSVRFNWDKDQWFVYRWKFIAEINAEAIKMSKLQKLERKNKMARLLKSILILSLPTSTERFRERRVTCALLLGTLIQLVQNVAPSDSRVIWR